MRKHLRNIIFYIFTGFILGFCYVAGYRLETYNTISFVDKSFYLHWLLTSAICSLLTYIIWKLLKLSSTLNTEHHPRLCKCINAVDINLPIWGYMIIILLCWLPTWLSIFPGAFTYDAYDEWLQISTGNITAHHPVLHVLLLGGLTEGIHQITGSYNLGIAIYTLIQMLFVSWVFGYTLQFLRRQKVCGSFRLFALIFYCFSPVIALFAICSTKDVIFTAGALLFMLLIIQLLQNPQDFFKTPKAIILFILSALITMIFRNNGLYIAVLTLIMVGVLLKRSIKPYLKLTASILVIYLCLNISLNHFLRVTPGGVEEMLSVPLQQLARVHYYEKDSFSTDDLELLYSILPEKNLNSYRVSVSDFVKCGFNRENFQNHKTEFVRLWIRTGINHPFTYINSFLLGTVDFWYPHAIMDGYRDVYNRSSYYDYQVSKPGTEVVLLPALHNLYEYISWDKEAQTHPGIFLLLSPGWYFVMFFIVFMYLLWQKYYRKILPLMVIVWNMFTVLLGPIALVRYVLILFYAFPLIFFFLKKDSDL